MYLARFLLPCIFVFSFAIAEDSEPSFQSDKYSGKQTQDWTDVQKRLAEKKAKLDTQAKLVENLIIEIAQMPQSEKLKKNPDLQIEHQKMQKLVEEYNQLSVVYQTKFPERGVKESRIYKRAASKCIEGIENELTLEGRLTNLHSKVIRQYPRSALSADSSVQVADQVVEQKLDLKKKKKSKPAIQIKPAVEKDVTEQIILQK